MTTHHPHDTLAKNFLSNLDVARDFLQHHLPAHIRNRCDFNTLRIESSSFIDDDLRPHVSDILYSLKINNKPGLIYCVVEAQSTPKKLMPFRIMRYQVAGLKKYAETHKEGPLPVIIPIVLYTGKESPYPYSMDFYDCFADPALAREIFLSPKLIDLTMTSDDEIKKHGQAAFLEIVSKHIRDRDILNLAYDLVELLNNYHITRELYLHLLHYVLDSGDSQNHNEFLNIIMDQTTKYKEETMTIAERLKQEGEQRGYQKGIHTGIQQGIGQGIEKGGYDAKIAIARNLITQEVDLEIIEKATGLTRIELLKLVKAH